MADNVPVTPSASYTVAAEDVGGVEFQKMKLVGGAAADTTGIGAGGTIGVSGTVSVVNGASVTIQQGASVSAVVSGTVTVANGVSVTIQQGASVSAVVSGLVSVTGVSLGVVVSGAVSVSAMPAVSISVSAVLGTVVTVLGTQVVTIAQTSVLAQASGTVSILNVVPVVTAASVSVTGLPVWLNPTQAVVVNTIAAGFSVNALVTGVVSVSVLPAVSISVSAVLGTIVTQLGTQIVTIAQTSVVALVSVSASAVLGTIVAVSGITAMSNLSTVVTVLGTVNVNLQNGLYTSTAVTTGTAQAVWIMNPTTVTVTVSVSQPFGDAIAFSFTSVSAPTVQTPALMDVAWLGTTVQTSMYVVPAGRRLRLNAIVVQVQNTAASIGIARGEVYVRASLSSSVTVGPVVAYGFGAANTSATGAGGGGWVDIGVDVSTTNSVGFAYKVTGGTGHIIGFVVMGNLY